MIWVFECVYFLGNDAHTVFCFMIQKVFWIVINKKSMVYIITEKHVYSVLSMQHSIDAVEKAAVNFVKSKRKVPKRILLRPQENQGSFLISGAHIESCPTLVKIASSYPDNKKLGLPTVGSIVLLFDPKTGSPIAIISANRLTAIKTGAVSALSFKYLARRDSKTIGIIGSGVEAWSHLEAALCTLNLKKCLVFSLNLKRAKTFCEKVEQTFKLESDVAQTVTELVKEADIVVTATTSQKPVFNGNDLREGTHVCAIGSFTPDASELDVTTIKKASAIYVDNWEATKVGDLRIPLERKIISKNSIIHIGEVITNKKQGRMDDKQITVFKSVGGAPYDVAVANLVFVNALEKNQYTLIDLNG